MKKRVISIALCLCLLVSLFAGLTVSASAEEAAQEVYMLLRKAVQIDFSAGDTYRIYVIGTNGEPVEVKVASINGIRSTDSKFDAAWDNLIPATEGKTDLEIANALPGTLLTYTTNADGKADIELLNNVKHNNVWINYEDLTDIATALTSYRATNRTRFVLISLTENGQYAFTPIAGITALKAAVGNYNYYQAATLIGADGDTADTAFIFVDSRNISETKTVFSSYGASEVKSEKIGYVTYEYFEVTAIEGDEIKTMKVLTDVFAMISETEFFVASGYTLNNDGFVTKVIRASYNYIGANDTGRVAYRDGTLTIGSMEYAQDDVNVYLYDAENETFICKKASAVREDDIYGEVLYLFNTASSNTTKYVTAIFARGTDGCSWTGNGEPTPIYDFTDVQSIQHIEAVRVLTGLGVMLGFEDGTFRPTETVTRTAMRQMIGYIENYGTPVGVGGSSSEPISGIEAAEMLLDLLGYNEQDAKNMDIAEQAGLFADLDRAAMTQSLCRDDAAQMIFNALLAPLVEYEIIGGTATVVECPHISFRGGWETTQLLCGEQYFIDPDDATKQLQLRYTMDAFGLELEAWFYGIDEYVGPIEIAKCLKTPAVYAESFSAQNLYALTGRITDLDWISVKVDGVNADDGSLYGVSYDLWVNGSAVNDFPAGKRAKSKILADEICVYITENDRGGRDIQIIGKNYYLGEIYAHSMPRNAYEYEYVKVAGISDGKAGAYETTAFTDEDVDQATKVIFTYSKLWDEIRSVERVEPIRIGAVTRIEMNDDGSTVITADGEIYTSKMGAKVYVDLDAEYDLYLNPNGKVLYAEEIRSDSNNYFMVMKKSVVTGSGLDAADDVFQVRLLGTDGKTVDLNVSKINKTAVESYRPWDLVTAAKTPVEEQEIADCTVGTIVTYTLDSKGKAELTTAAATTDFNVDTKAITIANYENLTNIATALTTKKATSDTTFVLISLDKNDNYVYTPVSGIAAMKAVTANYEFYQNVTVEVKSANSVATPDVAGVAFIFVGSRNVGTSKAVFTSLGISAMKTMYLTGEYGNRGVNYYDVTAIEDGAIKRLKVESYAFEQAFYSYSYYGGGSYNYFILASNYTIDEDGFVTKITKASDGYSDRISGDQLYDFGYGDGVLRIGGFYSVQDDVNVYLFDEEEETFVSARASQLQREDIATWGDVMFVLNTNGIGTKYVTAIFAIVGDYGLSTPVLGEKAKTLTTGETAQLSVLYGEDKTITWSSDNEAVATVDANGVVTAVAPGTASITVFSDGAETDVCAVTVQSTYLPVDPDDTVDPNAPQFVVQSRKARAGGKVDVTVSLKNNPGIASMNLLVSFGKDLTLTNVAFNDEIGGQYVLPQTMRDPVTLLWVNGTENLEGDAVIATLTFEVAENAAAEQIITVTYDPEDVYNIAEENLDFAVKRGKLQVVRYLPGDVNDDGNVNNKDLSRLMQYFAGWNVTVVEDALDLNGDGAVNNKDLTRLFQYLANWDVELR